MAKVAAAHGKFEIKYLWLASTNSTATALTQKKPLL